MLRWRCWRPAPRWALTSRLPRTTRQRSAAYAPSVVPTKPNRVILLDAARAGKNVVAVGERGVLLQSDDDGATWKGQRTPTTRTLTGVAFNDDKNGIAVGHGATILRTADGGTTWQPVKVKEAGIDSLLGAVALGGTRMVAYGAFGEYLESNDNGATWTRGQVIDAEFDRHISQVFKAGDKYVLVGESATLAASDDGKTYKKLESPYKGSWFGGLATKGGAWLIYGMRGNVYRSENAGATWTKIDAGGEQTIANGRVLADGRIVLVGVSGKIAISNDDGKQLRAGESRRAPEPGAGGAPGRRQAAAGRRGRRDQGRRARRRRQVTAIRND